MKMLRKPHLVILDGHSQIYRAIYSRGAHIGAVFVFWKMINSMLAKLRPHYFVMAIDGPRFELVRRKMFPAYKSSRPEPDEGIVHQVKSIIKFCRAIGFPLVAHKGWEADDVIATLVDILHDESIRTTIVSPDKDLHQLLRPGVSQFNPMQDKWLTQADVEKIWKVPVDFITQVQALCGDKTDDVPGVPGVGPVIAAKLINKYATARRVRENRGDLSPKLCTALAEFNPELSLSLVTMANDLRLKNQDFAWHGVNDKAVDLAFRSLGMPTRPHY